MDKPADCASPIVSSVAFKGKGMSLRRSELELSNEKKVINFSQGLLQSEDGGRGPHSKLDKHHHGQAFGKQYILQVIPTNWILLNTVRHCTASRLDTLTTINTLFK